MTEKKKPKTLFSELDLFILNKLLKEDCVCLRDITKARDTSNNKLIQDKLKNLINLGLIKKAKPKGKRLDYPIKNRDELKHLKNILNKTYNFYNPQSKATPLNTIIQATNT